MENSELREIMYTKPTVLAWIGDGYWTLAIREFIVMDQKCKASLMHRLSTRYVSAYAQANILSNILSWLNEDELDLLRRARNAHTNNVPKNTPPEVYKKSTSFEALIGYLYLSKQTDKLNKILEIAKNLEILPLK